MPTPAWAQGWSWTTEDWPQAKTGMAFHKPSNYTNWETCYATFSACWAADQEICNTNHLKIPHNTPLHTRPLPFFSHKIQYKVIFYIFRKFRKFTHTCNKRSNVRHRSSLKSELIFMRQKVALFKLWPGHTIPPPPRFLFRWDFGSGVKVCFGCWWVLCGRIRSWCLICLVFPIGQHKDCVVETAALPRVQAVTNLGAGTKVVSQRIGVVFRLSREVVRTCWLDHKRGTVPPSNFVQRSTFGWAFACWFPAFRDKETWVFLKFVMVYLLTRPTSAPHADGLVVSACSTGQEFSKTSWNVVDFEAALHLFNWWICTCSTCIDHVNAKKNQRADNQVLCVTQSPVGWQHAGNSDCP